MNLDKTYKPSFRFSVPNTYKNGGRRRIRTFERKTERIYSPHPLASWISYHSGSCNCLQEPLRLFRTVMHVSFLICRWNHNMKELRSFWSTLFKAMKRPQPPPRTSFAAKTCITYNLTLVHMGLIHNPS